MVGVVHGVATIEAYGSHPVGRFLWGPTYVVWFFSPTLQGIMFWDRPVEEDIQRIGAALDGELRWGVGLRRASLIDLRRVTAVDLGGFTALLQWAQSRRDALARVITRQAFVRPEGLVGATTAGFPALFAPAYPIEIFTDPVAALDWLGVDDHTQVVAELDAIHATASGGSTFVAAIRAHLEQHPGALLPDTAQAFGLSQRNLQRKLTELQTTFQFEQNAARVRLAKTLLLETNHDLKRIAFEVGCASLQNFSALFHKSMGESPSHWRSRQRPDDFPPRDLARRTTGALT
jgi:AraC-like DNA-binding protein